MYFDPCPERMALFQSVLFTKVLVHGASVKVLAWKSQFLMNMTLSWKH